MERKLFTKLKNKENPFEVLTEWTSLEREWVPRERAWFVSYGFFFVAIITLLVVIEEYILIVLIISFVFLWFTQALVRPDEMTHKITTLGIKTFGKVFKWKNIKHFWFSNKGETHFLNLEVENEDININKSTQRLSLIIEEEQLDELFNVIIDFSDYGDKEEVGYNILTRLINGKFIPISTFLKDEATKK